MKTGKAYEHLSEWFEYLNDDCGYPAWSEYIVKKLKTYQVGYCGLELGCGSGAFCRALAREGYTMSGADISSEMLTKAQHLCTEENLSVKFFLADAARLVTPEKYDFIISPNDCFNYLPPSALVGAFKKVRACLKTGGIFLFDVSSEYKLRRKVADTVSVDDREELTYLCFSKLNDNQVELSVSLFVRSGDGTYKRFDESHTQYIHSEEFLTAVLKEAGFEILSLEGHLGENKEGSDRLNFICRR